MKHTAWRVDGSAGGALFDERLARRQVVVFRGDDIHAIEDVLVHLLEGVVRNRSTYNESYDSCNGSIEVEDDDFRNPNLIKRSLFDSSCIALHYEININVEDIRNK